MKVDLRLEATAATVVMEQTYRNMGDRPVEAHFSMGLGKKLAVFRFQVERDGKVVEAEIKKTADARDDYDDAISMGHTGVMAEVSETGSFDMSLGNLPSGSTLTVRAFIIAPVESDQDVLFFGLPSDFFPNARLPYELTLTGSASFPGGVESMIVTHGVSQSLSELPFYKSNQKVHDGVFAVQITPRLAFDPSVAIEDDGKSLAAALTFYPSWDHIDPDLLTPYVEVVRSIRFHTCCVF